MVKFQLFCLEYSTLEQKSYCSTSMRRSTHQWTNVYFSLSNSIFITLQIMFVSMNMSNARIFPSNLTSHNEENINEMSQSVLIVWALFTSPLSFRSRAFAKRSRRRFRTSSNVEIRKISPNDSIPWKRDHFSISEMNQLMKDLNVRKQARIRWSASTVQFDTRCLLRRTIKPNGWIRIGI